MNKSILLILLITTPVDAGIYKWTDSNGNIHYGDQPAISKPATELNIKINKHTGVTNSSSHKSEREYLLKKISERKEEATKKRKEFLASSKKRRKLCNAYRSEYQGQIQANQLYEMSPNGERTYLSDKERVARKKKLKKGITKYCH